MPLHSIETNHIVAAQPGRSVDDRDGDRSQASALFGSEPTAPVWLRTHSPDIPGDRRAPQRLKRPTAAIWYVNDSFLTCGGRTDS